MLIVGDEGADKVSQSKTSLQENFEKFRKQKQVSLALTSGTNKAAAVYQESQYVEPEESGVQGSSAVEIHRPGKEVFRYSVCCALLETRREALQCSSLFRLLCTDQTSVTRPSLRFRFHYRPLELVLPVRHSAH